MCSEVETPPSSDKPTECTSGGVAANSPPDNSGCPTRTGVDASPETANLPLAALIERIPEGWTPATYEGRRYGLTRTTLAHGRSIRVFAEELGGPDLISANVYLTRRTEHLRPCEMAEAKVLAFLRGWRPA